ncbi:MAG: class I SAM-dependent methyltransferase [Planctomycetota bacterium]|nr:class I SAM-dependent methyltransferase [Planctomycetota bacterium]MDA1177350.1 class I SAM-dependent methyltransferase [Planctomycetota bacterium]
MNDDQEFNEVAREVSRRTYDRMAIAQQRFARPINREQLSNPLAQVDAVGWLGGDIRGWRVLCLAAGGGRQAPLYAAAGGEVTVVDLSPEMLRLDREVANAYGLNVKTIEASMDHLPMLSSGSFDLCIHPVSTCYLANVILVFQEVARVVRAGGLYISQHKTPTSLQASTQPVQGLYQMETPYYWRGPLPAVSGSLHREEGAIEFLHRWEVLVGGMCRSGFVIEDLVEPVHGEATADVGTFSHRSQYVAPYVRIKARKTGTSATSSGPQLELPWQ